MKTIVKNHIIMIIGLTSFLMTFFAQLAIVKFDLQYDDSGIGAILILGKPIYGSIFWIICELFPKGDNMLPVYIIGLLIFLCMDLMVMYCRKTLKNRKDKNRGQLPLK